MRSPNASLRGARLFLQPLIGRRMLPRYGRYARLGALSYERTHILCATHGARFRMGDGHCIHGPCIGKALVAVAVRLEGENIVLVDEREFLPIIP